MTRVRPMCTELYGENYPNYGVSLGNGFVNKYAAAEKSIECQILAICTRTRETPCFCLCSV